MSSPFSCAGTMNLSFAFTRPSTNAPKVLIGYLQPIMDRLHISPAIDAGSTSRRADLINEVALEFPDIESREPSIDPGIGGCIDHNRSND